MTEPLQTKEVARRLGVSTTRVHQLVREHKLTARKLAGLRGPLLFDADEVERFQKERAT